MQEELGPQDPQNITPLTPEELTGPLNGSGTMETPQTEESEVMNQATAAARSMVDQPSKFSTKTKLMAGAAGLATAVVGGGLAYNAAQHNGNEQIPSAIATSSEVPTPEETNLAPVESPSATPTDTHIAVPNATKSVIIKPSAESKQPVKTEQATAAPTKSPETAPINYDQLMYENAEKASKTVESFGSNSAWTVEKFTDPQTGDSANAYIRNTTVANHPDMNGQYRFTVEHNKAGGLSLLQLKETASSSSDGSSHITTLKEVTVTIEGEQYVAYTTLNTGNNTSPYTTDGFVYNKPPLREVNGTLYKLTEKSVLDIINNRLNDTVSEGSSGAPVRFPSEA